MQASRARCLLLLEPEEIIYAACKRTCEADNSVTLHTLPQPLIQFPT
jgi:hypothetical protein